MIPKPTQNLPAGTAEKLEDVWLSGHTQDFIAWLAYQICQTFNRLSYNGGALLLIILQLKKLGMLWAHDLLSDAGKKECALLH